MQVNRDELANIKCRFGCDAPIGIFHVPEGCICWRDPVQALCGQHLYKAESMGSVICIVDFMEGQPDRRAGIRSKRNGPERDGNRVLGLPPVTRIE